MKMEILVSLLSILYWFTAGEIPQSAAKTTDSIPFYDIQAAIDPESGSINVHLTLTAPVHLLKDNSLSFLLSPDADVSSITGKHLTGYDVNDAEPGVSIYNLQFDTTSSSTISFEMAYLLFIPNNHQVNRISMDWIELNIDSFWHPVLTSFSRFHYRLNVDLNESYQILSGDHLIPAADDSHTRTIESRIPRIDISLSASKQFYSREGKYSAVYSTNTTTNLDSLLQFSEQALSFLDDYLVVPKDFTQKRIVVESPREEVGYARENYVVMSMLDGMDPVSLSGFLAHEFSHYWFLNANPRSPDHWLNESFAEFLAMIYIRDSYGTQAYLDELENKLERVKNNPSSLSSYQNRPSHTALYYTGPLVLHHFEEYAGKDRFRSLLQKIIRNEISTTEDLFILIRNHLGPKEEEKLIELHNTQFH